MPESGLEQGLCLGPANQLLDIGATSLPEVSSLESKDLADLAIPTVPLALLSSSPGYSSQQETFRELTTPLEGSRLWDPGVHRKSLPVMVHSTSYGIEGTGFSW